MRIAVAALLLACACTACKGAAPAAADPDGGGIGSSLGVPANDAKLNELEKHLKYGKTWGSDAIAKKIADEVADAIRDEWTPSHDIAVAVSIIPASPRQVVIVAQVKTLKEESKSNRQVIVDNVQAAIKDGLGPNDEVTFGVKGQLVYGIMATGVGRAKWTTKLGKMVAPDPLIGALAKTPSAPPRAIAKVGEPLTVEDMEWLVVAVEDKGRAPKPVGKNFRAPTSADGKFIVVKLKATNHAKNPRSLSQAPKLVDAKGREFGTHPEQDMLIPDGAKAAGWQDMQPDIGLEFWAAYEVAADAKGLQVKVRGPYDYSTPGFIELGI